MRAVLLPAILLFVLTSCLKDGLDPNCEVTLQESDFLRAYDNPETAGVQYFIDPILGSEFNSGMTEASPITSLLDLSLESINPGDQILFKSGVCHEGQFMLELSGTSKSPIVISSYGPGHLPIVISKQETVFSFFSSEHVVIQNLSIRGGKDQSILLSNSNHFQIQGCRIGLDAHAGIVATSEYSDGEGSNFGRIEHCFFDSGRRGNTGDLQSTDAVRLIDGASEWKIENNEFRAWAHSSVSIKQIETFEKNNSNFVVSNLFDCRDIDYMRALDISGGEGLASNNVFFGNLILKQSVSSHLHGDSNLAAYNIFSGIKTSTSSEQPWGIDFHIFTNIFGNPGRKDLVCHSNRLYNNLFYDFPNGTAVVILNPKNEANNDVSDIEIRNNIMYNIGHALEVEEEAYSIKITNNLVFNENSESRVQWHGKEIMWQDFESRTGTNGYTIRDNLNVDPLFVDLENEDFELELGSMCIDMGWSHEISSDFQGSSINGSPDIGPLEHE